MIILKHLKKTNFHVSDLNAQCLFFGSWLCAKDNGYWIDAKYLSEKFRILFYLHALFPS